MRDARAGGRFCPRSRRDGAQAPTKPHPTRPILSVPEPPRSTRPRRSPLRLRPRVAAFVALAALATSAFLTGASATVTTQTFTTVADTWVAQDQTRTNFGTDTKLKIDASPIQRAYLRLTVTGLRGNVLKATRKLEAAAASTVGYDVHRVADSSWGEQTMTYTNAPAFDTAVLGSTGAIA